MANFWGLPLVELHALGAGGRVRLDASVDAEVVDHLHCSGRLRVLTLDSAARAMLVIYDAVEKIL